MKFLKFAEIGFMIICALFCLSLLGMGLKWCGRAKQVVQQELDPQNLLNRNMWFKDASAMLDKHLADAKTLKFKCNNLQEMYKGESRKDWARVDAEQCNLWLSEVDGIKTAYTNLAAEYNAAMAKINYRFTNIGKLPQGADKVLPREYKPYSEILN